VKYVVGLVADIPPGGRRIVTAGARSVGVFNVDGEFFAVRNRCPHQGGPLCEGSLWGRVVSPAPGRIEYSARREMLACPWHGWAFDIRTGRSWCEPARLRVRGYAVTVEDGLSLKRQSQSGTVGLVSGPYTAETFPVALDGEFVVVDVPD
jgi:nitrite reductase/ring-hydroxylating ferredoxin subunit